MKASGKFIVRFKPEGNWHPTDETVHKMAIERQFHGDLEATSEGQIISLITDVKSGVSVAIERVTGTMHGYSGTFALQHADTWTREASRQEVSLVEDSGTGELAGLIGKMTFDDTYGNQTYEFEYTLPILSAD